MRCTSVPPPLIRRRAAAVAVTPIVLFALAGCRPPATSPADATPTASPTASPTPWLTAVLTLPVTATFTPLATLDPAVPAPVSMTLDEAKAEALSWFDASRSPRVEWAGYVRREVIGAGLENGLIYDGFARHGRPIADLSAVGIVVVASTFGLSMPLDAAKWGQNGPCGRVGGCGDETMREGVITVFDALTGERFAAMPDKPAPDQLYQPDVAALRAEPAPWTERVGRPPSATPTAAWDRGTSSMPTPTMFPTPDAPPLRADNVPAPMRPALSTFPLLPGSRWRWRVTGRYEGVKWSAWTVEEVVEAGWILADDRIVVRSHRSCERLSGDPLGMEEGPHIDTVWRTIHADGAVESAEQTLRAEPNYMPVGCCSPADIAVFLDPEPDPTERASWVIDSQTAAHQTVVTEAGRFDDCATFYTVGGNDWGWLRAVCRGVGIVRGELAANSWSGAAIESMELVEYDVVLPR